MLLELHVRNFAVIRDATVEFRESFNALTGETGAGKSLLVDALLMLMGRGGAEYIRSGEESALIEAVFQMEDELKDAFEELSEGDHISLRKVIAKGGKSKQYINGVFVNQSRIRELLGRLLHVYGQSEAKELYDATYHVEMYDIYCDNSGKRAELKEFLQQGRELRKELDALKEKEAKRTQEMDFLAYQIDEIQKAALDADDEEETLNAKRAVLQSREKILTNLGVVYELLYEKEGAVNDLLAECVKRLDDIGNKDAVLEEGGKELHSISEAVKNQAYTFKSFIESLEDAQDDLNSIEERLDIIYRLKKKYGGSIAAVKAFLQDAETKMDELKNLGKHEGEIEGNLGKIRVGIQSVCAELSKHRVAKEAEFKKAIEKELRDLGMPKAAFAVSITHETFEFAEDTPMRGAERVEFLFSSHSGEPVKPLSKIASGGELSRVMLAIKNVIPKEQSMTVIFDEVDAGVGGKTAEMLGKKLKDIAAHHQVICITHLPQVAVWSNHHIRVDKAEKSGRVEVSVNPLAKQARIDEITRMLGSDEGSKGMEYAKEMLEKAR